MPTRCAARRTRSPNGARTSTSRSRSRRPSGESMAPLVRELSESGVKVNVTARVHHRAGRADHRGGQGRRAVLHLGVRRADRRRGRRSGAADGARRRRSWSTRRASELIWASPREILNVVQADQVGCHIITVTHDLLPEARPARQGSAAVLARDGADVPPRRARGRFHACRTMQRACITGGAGFIGSHLADRLRATVSRSSIVDDFRTGRREFVEQLRDDPGVTPVRGRRARRGAARARLRGLRLGLPPAGERRRPPRARAPAAGPRTEHDRHGESARGDAGRGRVEDRLLVDRLGVRRAGRVPDAGGRAVPGPDLAVRRRPSWPARA